LIGYLLSCNQLENRIARHLLRRRLWHRQATYEFQICVYTLMFNAEEEAVIEETKQILITWMKDQCTFDRVSYKIYDAKSQFPKISQCWIEAAFDRMCLEETLAIESEGRIKVYRFVAMQGLSRKRDPVVEVSTKPPKPPKIHQPTKALDSSPSDVLRQSSNTSIKQFNRIPGHSIKPTQSKTSSLPCHIFTSLELENQPPSVSNTAYSSPITLNPWGNSTPTPSEDHQSECSTDSSSVQSRLKLLVAQTLSELLKTTDEDSIGSVKRIRNPYYLLFYTIHTPLLCYLPYLSFILAYYSHIVTILPCLIYYCISMEVMLSRAAAVGCAEAQCQLILKEFDRQNKIMICDDRIIPI
jgi:hypothetical protein